MQEIKMKWDNWNAICDFVPKDQFIKGVFLNEKGKVSANASNNLGLKIKINDKERLAKEGDYLVKGKKNDKCLIMSEKMMSLKNKLKKCKI